MADIEMNSLDDVYLKKLSSRLLDYIETVNMGLIVFGSELGNLIVENGLEGTSYYTRLKRITDDCTEPLNNYLDCLFDLQTLATFIEIDLLPDDLKEDAIKMVEEEREAYRSKVEQINNQINKKGDQEEED